MDFSDINKIANRKTMIEDFKMLQEKMSREIENILKLKVAQATSYECLKEKYQQLETNHERLQQNIVEVQIQYENISALYQDELRRRPETLNKVKATRKICDVLVEHIEKLKETLARTKADQVVLADMYELASQEVQKMGKNFTTAYNQARLEIRDLQNQLQRSKESEANALNEACQAKAHGELLKREAIEQLKRATAEQDHHKAMLLKASKTIAVLQRSIKQHHSEYEAKTTEILKANENLKKECAEAKRMVEEERALRQAAETSIVNLEATLHSLKLEQAVLMEKSEREILNKEMLVKSKDSELVQITGQMEMMIIENSKNQGEAQRRLEEFENKIIELTIANQEAAHKAQKDLDELRMSHEQKVSELESILGKKDAELDAKMKTITQLMNDVTNSTDVNAGLEAALKNAHERAQVSAETERSLQTRIEMLQADLREKEVTITQLNETGRQITAEKEELEAKCQGLQNTIENVHKELKLRDGERREEPERDTSVKNKQDDAKSVGQRKYFNFSDTSDDDPMALDRADINRCFEALQRGERITEPLRTRGEMARLHVETHVKRRRSFFPSRGGLDKKPKRQQTEIHLKNIP